jgi:hypothetical protein
MNKKLLTILLSSTLILTSCFSPVLASETSLSDESTNDTQNFYSITLDKDPARKKYIAERMAMSAALSFGLGFIPAGTPLFAFSTFLTVGLNGHFIGCNFLGIPDCNFDNLELRWVVGSGIVGHIIGFCCFLKWAQAALEAKNKLI